MDDSVVVPLPVNDTISTASDPPPMAPVSPVKRSARRCLFGRPDPKNTDRWLTEELNKIRHEQKLKWGFLFDPENPCASTTTTDWEFTAVPADSVPQFYRSSYYSSKSCDVENCIPCSSIDSRNDNIDSTIVASECSDPEVPVLPPIRAVAAAAATKTLPKRRMRRAPKKQTKLPEFMNVDSRKRLRQQAKDDVNDNLFNNSAGAATIGPSPSKSVRLIGHYRSSV